MISTKHAVSFILYFLLLFCADYVYSQDDYQAEISTTYSHFRDQDNDESNTYSASALMHFAPVNTSGHPLAEASFLERIGSVTLFGGHGEGEGSFWESDGNYYGASLTFMKPNYPLPSTHFTENQKLILICRGMKTRKAIRTLTCWGSAVS